MTQDFEMERLMDDIFNMSLVSSDGTERIPLEVCKILTKYTGVLENIIIDLLKETHGENVVTILNHFMNDMALMEAKNAEEV
jgi:hypothetical protein